MYLRSRPEIFKLTSHAIRFFAAVLIAFVFVPVLEAKTSTVSGIIFTLGSDKVQTVWPNARVTLKNVDTGSEAATISNDLGTYAFTGVLYGHYEITVTLAGFESVYEKRERGDREPCEARLSTHPKRPHRNYYGQC